MGAVSIRPGAVGVTGAVSCVAERRRSSLMVTHLAALQNTILTGKPSLSTMTAVIDLTIHDYVIDLTLDEEPSTSTYGSTSLLFTPSLRLKLTPSFHFLAAVIDDNAEQPINPFWAGVIIDEIQAADHMHAGTSIQILHSGTQLTHSLSRPPLFQVLAP